MPGITSQNIAQTISLSASKQEFGIEGYRLPKHGIPPRNPQYSVPKDKLSNFLEQTQRRGKALPAPSTYHKPISWETQNGQFGKNSKRKTFTDEVQKIAKAVPSSAHYKPWELPKNNNVPLGKTSYFFGS